MTDLGALTVDSERSNRWCQQHIASNSSEPDLFGGLCNASVSSVTAVKAAKCAPSVAFAGHPSSGYATVGRVLSADGRAASRLSYKPEAWHDVHLIYLGHASVTAVWKLGATRDGSERVGRVGPVVQGHSGLGQCLGDGLCSL